MESRSVPRPSGFSLPLVVVAVAAGVAAGLLLAPRPGSALRATVRDRATDASQRLRTYAASSYEWAQQWLNRPAGSVAGRTVAFSETPVALTATLGELSGVDQPAATTWEATS
jgi:gas vesicle protein